MTPTSHLLLPPLLVAAVSLILLPQAAQAQLTWNDLDDYPQALCNDFTRAGYFMREGFERKKWVIFLESGGLCYSSETCNRRFFLSEVRSRFERDGDSSFGPFDNFDVGEAWNNTLRDLPPDEQKQRAPEVLSTLMTSMKCVQNRTSYFPRRFAIEGRDIMDRNCFFNPLFCNHSQVVIPYCSSDVWLGNEMDNTRNDTAAESECDCFDYDCFKFKPERKSLQFTFRGKIIYQSVIQDLLFHLKDADEVVLVGSSAGGLGVINHAKWTREQLPSMVKLRVIFDSSWFINFQGSIYTIFDGTQTQTESEESSANANTLLSILKSNDACSDVHLGYPCCISAHCVLPDSRYYPQENVSTFGLISLYDVFLLTPAIGGLSSIEDNEGNSLGYAIDFLRTVGEYGGAMNNTISETESQADHFSFYVTQCFQHIYLATSSLWGQPGASVYGDSSVDLEGDIGLFTHTIESRRWSSRELATHDAERVTMRDALQLWYNSNRSEPMRFRDSCTGPYCNLECPETFVLGDLTSNNWPYTVKIAIVCIVMGIGLVTLVMKVLFVLWLCWLERSQLLYLESLEDDFEGTDSRLQFPDCSDEEAIAVACLDLHYSVTFRAKQVKDEHKDNTSPVVLQDIAPKEEQENTEPAPKTPSIALKVLTRGTSGLFNLSSPTREKGPGHSKTGAPTTPLIPQTSISFEGSVPAGAFGRRKKEILKGISTYFNPGKLIGIMGPSGCGKTTFLDLLTGRRKKGTIKGEIYINGIQMREVQDWYVANTGYVLQLATPYYEELTVRENLTLAAMIKLPPSFRTRERFRRVEQVMEVTGLLALAETVVGGATGPGLSGGQKRRLAVALQLLKLPSVIFLDEPTSGLDAASSMELLKHLNRLADSNRTVILTIHQPRLEIFHMFDRLVLISDGKVAYHGAPERAYEVFVSSLNSRFREHGMIIPLLEDHNPADVIMDMLGNQRMRQLITEYYQGSSEPRMVRRAIVQAAGSKLSSSGSIDNVNPITYAIWGKRKVGDRHNRTFPRLASLEARGSKRAGFAQSLYLPVIFFAYAFLMGTVYFQQDSPFLIVSAFCVYSVASALFMFPYLYLYLQKALHVYEYEHADGVGRAHDLVIQGFIRGSTAALFPVVICAGVLYLLLIRLDTYDFIIYGQLAVVNVALNQTWIALLIFVICAFPDKAFRLSPIISSVAGFTSGFFIPINEIPWWYRWLSYINPNYYGFSSSAFLLLDDFDSNCEGTQFECYTSSGESVLAQFNFDNINPYLHIVVLFSFTVFYLLMATFSNWVRYTTIGSKIKRVKRAVRKPTKSETRFKQESVEIEHQQKLAQRFPRKGRPSTRDPTKDPSPIKPMTSPLSPIHESEEQERQEGKEMAGLGLEGILEPLTPHSTNRARWQMAVQKSLNTLDNGEAETEFQKSVEEEGLGDKGLWFRPHREEVRDQSKRPSQLSLGSLAELPSNSAYLQEGESHHVWKWKPKPKMPPQGSRFASIALEALQQKREKDLSERQRSINSRVQATQAVLREQNEELILEDLPPLQEKKKYSLKDASHRITENIRQTKENEPWLRFSDIVSSYVSGRSSSESTPKSTLKRQESGSKVSTPAVGAMPIVRWKELVRERRKHQWQEGLHGRSQTEYPIKNIPIFEPTMQHHASAENITIGHQRMGATTDSSTGGLSSVGSKRRTFPKQNPVDVTDSPLASLKRAPRKRSLVTKQQAEGWKDSQDSMDSSTSTPRAALRHKGDRVSTDSSSSTPIAAKKTKEDLEVTAGEEPVELHPSSPPRTPSPLPPYVENGKLPGLPKEGNAKTDNLSPKPERTPIFISNDYAQDGTVSENSARSFSPNQQQRAYPTTQPFSRSQSHPAPSSLGRHPSRDEQVESPDYLFQLPRGRRSATPDSDSSAIPFSPTSGNKPSSKARRHRVSETSVNSSTSTDYRRSVSASPDVDLMPTTIL